MNHIQILHRDHIRKVGQLGIAIYEEIPRTKLKQQKQYLQARAHFLHEG